MASLRKLALIAKHGRKAVLAATAQEQRSRTGQTVRSFPRTQRSTRGQRGAPWETKRMTVSRFISMFEAKFARG